MTDTPTTGELLKAKAILSDEVDAAVDAVLAKPDLGAAIKAHNPALAALTDLDRPEKFKRTMARTAILLARPKKA